jgi:hypothetical protein
MAYLRKEYETVETDHSLNEVWLAVQKVLRRLKWKTELVDETGHHVEARTKAGLMSYGSLLLIDIVPVDNKTTRVSVAAETPTTTITAMVDFGQTRDRITLFLTALAKQLTG